MPKISELSVNTTPDDPDELAIVDDSAGTTKKITLAGVLAWLRSKLNWVAYNNIDYATFPFQVVAAGQATATSAGATITIPTQPNTNYYVSTQLINSGSTNNGYVVVDNKSTTSFRMTAVPYQGLSVTNKVMDYTVVRTN